MCAKIAFNNWFLLFLFILPPLVLLSGNDGLSLATGNEILMRYFFKLNLKLQDRCFVSNISLGHSGRAHWMHIAPQLWNVNLELHLKYILLKPTCDVDFFAFKYFWLCCSWLLTTTDNVFTSVLCYFLCTYAIKSMNGGECVSVCSYFQPRAFRLWVNRDRKCSHRKSWNHSYCHPNPVYLYVPFEFKVVFGRKWSWEIPGNDRDPRRTVLPGFSGTGHGSKVPPGSTCAVSPRSCPGCRQSGQPAAL